MPLTGTLQTITAISATLESARCGFNNRTTLGVYKQAVNSHKGAAQSKVVKMIVPNLGEARGESHPRSA
jgi:hypothetical protein